MDDKLKQIGRNIAEFRNQANPKITQWQLSKSAKIHKNNLSNIERGAIVISDMDTLYRIANVLSKDVNSLIYENLSYYQEKRYANNTIKEINKHLVGKSEKELKRIIRMIECFKKWKEN